MAEEFLDGIYREAEILCELRQIVEWVKVQDDHQAIMRFNELAEDMRDLCQRYVEENRVRGLQLWDAIQSISKIKGDFILLGDVVERRLIPLLEERMGQRGRIELENEEGDFRFESTVSGFLTLKNLERNIYYHSTVDPMWEARKLAEYIFEPQKDTYSILGCGLGYLAYQLYNVSKGSIVINIYEKDARIVEYARNYGVLDWIPEEHLNVVVEDDILPFLYSAQEENVGFYMFAPEFRGETQEVHEALDDLYMEFVTAKKFDKYVDINFWRNIKSDSKLVTEFDTSKLKKEFVVIAAGPSLDDNLDFLRANKGKRTLIAVGTVFKKLIKIGIVPDIVVVLDPQERTYKQIEGVEDQKVPMLIAMSAFWKFAAAYQGDKYLVPVAQNKEIRDYAIEHNANVWGCGGTVTSMAMECAIQFGAEKIYFVGVDLAYPNGVSHATGTMDRTTKALDNLIPVEGVGNQTAYATRGFVKYRKWIEERITQTPAIAYYNLSQVGAKIVGAVEISGDVDNIDELEPVLALENPKRFLYISEGFTKEEWEKLWDRTFKGYNDRVKLVVGMECLDNIGDSTRYEEYLALLQKTQCMKWDEKYYLMWQIIGRLFAKSGIETNKLTQMTYQLYHEILVEFMKELEPLETVDDRNDDLVLVTVQQFLNLMHGPTKTTLDRTRVLKTILGKNVMIINTAELFGGREVNILHPKGGNYFPEYLSEDKVKYEEEVYPFMQFELNMPNALNISEFLAFVKKYKPSYIVNIGGESLLVDACSKLVPVLNINTVPSKIHRTEASVQVIGRELTEEDDKLLTILGKDRSDVIVGRFTSSLKPQNHHYTKAELGIPDNRFILVAVGGRLTTEISDAFIQMIDNVLAVGAVLVIIGEMKTYDKVCAKDIVFKENTINLGMQEDVLAILEHCDLYVNPERMGGGTSVIEAMYKGCPPVTLRGGDVALGAGETFCVDSYEDMKEQILRYMSDIEFYQEMSEKAKERAAYMLDSDTAFVEIIQTFEKKISESIGG